VPEVSLEERSRLEESFAALVAEIVTFAHSLPSSACKLFGELLYAARSHPFIGDEVDIAIVAAANEHIAHHVQPSRRRAREVADRVRTIASTRADHSALISDADGRELGAALRSKLASLPELERFHLRELLSNALGGLAPTGEVPRSDGRHAAWIAATDALNGDWDTPPMPERPSFVTTELLAALNQEAGMQSFLSVRMALRYVGPPGPVAAGLGLDPRLAASVAAKACELGLRPGNGFTGGNATYLFYEDPGDCVQPHVDPFGLTNALLLLEHQTSGVNGEPSRLVVYGRDGEPTPVPLRVGELVILSGGAVVHARKPVRAGERVTLVSFVFAPPVMPSSV
jgi:hypothetical protein